MPIKDLTETLRIPRLGKIHLGIKHPEKGYPMKTDYFVLPTDHSSYKQLVAIFGEKPKELRVLIPSEDEEVWATQYYKAYDQTRGLVCKGDGETSFRMVDVATGALPVKDTKEVKMVEMSCAGKDCPEYKAKKCGETMNLKFMLPEIPGLGVWQIDTGSINSILNVNSCARTIKKTFGRLTLVPLILSLEPAQVNNPKDGKKQTVYVLNLRTNVTLTQLADLARESAKTLHLTEPALEAEYDRQLQEDVDACWPEGKNETKAIEAEVVKPAPAAAPAPIAPKAEPAAATNTAEDDWAAMPSASQVPAAVDLATLEFKNAGEFKAACLKHFNLQSSQVDKEISMYDLGKPEQRKKAWLEIVAVYKKEAA